MRLSEKEHTILSIIFRLASVLIIIGGIIASIVMGVQSSSEAKAVEEYLQKSKKDSYYSLVYDAPQTSGVTSRDCWALAIGSAMCGIAFWAAGAAIQAQGESAFALRNLNIELVTVRRKLERLEQQTLTPDATDSL